jgi:sodium/hydrogen exchanger-like protein 6/7
MSIQTYQMIFILILLAFLSTFFILEAYIAHKKFLFGHTTSVIVILGILASFLIRYIVINDKQTDSDILFQSLRFNDDIFFDLIVPIIIFPSGYNMRRKKFFSNIGSIMKFGFLGTIICFAVYSGMTYFVNSQEWIYYTNSAGEQVPI